MKIHLTHNKTCVMHNTTFNFEGLRIGTIVSVPEIGKIKITGGSGRSGAPMKNHVDKTMRAANGKIILPGVITKNIVVLDATLC